MEPPILLRTKFLVPRRRAGSLARPQLLARLDRALDRRLILISAPPGYGKTTLLADFAAATALPHAWYQLDSADGDALIFLAALIESLRAIWATRAAGDHPFTGSATRALLASVNHSVTPERILKVLINELAEATNLDCVLVLEDYHLIVNPAVHALVDTFIDHAPPGLHVIISTRSDPPLALARLRARGQLAELRAPDLRLSEQEIGMLLEQQTDGVASASVRALSEKTEGWAAGIQLALNSLDGRDAADADRFIADLSGTHRFVFEYLAGEVFRRQPPAVQQFLLGTAILTQMNATACDALLGTKDAQAMLGRIEQDNLFIVSLDEQREWYRYHHLFREFLLAKLRREQPDDATLLERRAGAYYEARGELEAALNHYLQGDDSDAAARLLAIIAPDYLERGLVEVLRRYLAALPDELIRANPAFLLYHGGVLRRLGQAGAAIFRYEEARAAYAAQGDTQGICRALTELAEIARSQGNYRRAQALATEAIEGAPLDDHAGRAWALMALAKSEGLLTSTDRGRALAEQALAEARLAGPAITRRAFAALLRSLGQICWWHGDPQATLRYCQEALQTVPDDLSPIAAEALITMATPYMYGCDLAAALRCAERALEISQRLQLNELLPMVYTTLGNVLTRYGEHARAESCLQQAMELSNGLGLETHARVMAAGYLAYNLCAQGRGDQARQLVESALWPYAGDPNTYEVCVGRSVLADIALDAGQLDEAERMFTELVEVNRRRQFRIPLAMVYFGLAYIALQTGRQQHGVELARESLRLIEPTGALQLYLDQGERGRLICRALSVAGQQSTFVRRVLDRLRRDSAPQVLEAVRSTVVDVRCLGRFRVCIDGVEVTQDRWVSAKARDLLAYFITFRHERIAIDRVLDALWPASSARAKTAFHTALYRMRHALALPQLSSKFVLAAGGEYQLDAARFRVDIDEFNVTLAKARSSCGREAAALYTRAIELYSGEYLDNLYADWLLPERERLRNAYLEALRARAGLHAQEDDYALAFDLTQRALQLDPLMEDVHCEALRYLTCLGDRAGLVRHYQWMEQEFERELGIAPRRSTRQLYAALLDQML